VQEAIHAVCDRLAERGIVTKDICPDGDPGYNEPHKKFFLEWLPHLLAGGLSGALNYVSRETKLPVGDFLHILETFLQPSQKSSRQIEPGFGRFILRECRRAQSAS
jgi:hypothetical protein